MQEQCVRDIKSINQNPSSREIMNDVSVRSLKEGEEARFFEFSKTLPDLDFWGRKGRYLRGGPNRFKEFLDCIEPFQPKCFLIAEEENRIVGFLVAVYNPEWVKELTERYGYQIERRAHILGIALSQKRTDVLRALTSTTAALLSRNQIHSVEYPTQGNVCLTTGTDVLTPENLDSMIVFREAGFKIDECYYSMRLDLDRNEHQNESELCKGMFCSGDRCIEIREGEELLGKIMWDPIEDGGTEIGIQIAPTHRRKGFGTALMAKALMQLRTEGANRVNLGVDGNNIPALRLYRKFGFEVTKTHFYILLPFDALIPR